MRETRLNKIDILTIIIILITIIVTVGGILSFDTGRSYEVINQYGDSVRIFGSGIYSHDSYFKAPVQIGSDFTILVIAVPLLIAALINEIRVRSNKTKLSLLSMLSVILYYALSLAAGATYNSFHLLYIALFSCSLFAVFALAGNIDKKKIRDGQQWRLPSKGISAFLILSGIALVAAWMPDIITSLATGSSLALIEVYTTEITYVLDMGIIGPLCLICLHLLNKKDGLGDVLLAIILIICIIIAVMMIPQTIYQYLSGAVLVWGAVITKAGSFVVLGCFAAYFNRKLYTGMRISEKH